MNHRLCHVRMHEDNIRLMYMFGIASYQCHVVQAQRPACAGHALKLRCTPQQLAAVDMLHEAQCIPVDDT